MIKVICLLLLSAGSLGLAFYPFKFSQILSWFGFIPFFFAIKDINNRFKVFFLSYLWGILFWVLTLYWLIHVTFLGLVLLVLYLGLYPALFGIVFFKFKEKDSLGRIFLLASFWVLGEYLRSYLFTGFGWALLGYSQYKNISLIQLADIGGVWLVSFLVIGINISLYYLVKFKKIKYFLFILLSIIIPLLYGDYRLFSVSIRAEVDSSPLRIAVIQGNIPQQLKWQEDKRDFIMERYFELTYQSLRENPDLIIWPEASLPAVKEEPLYYRKVLDFISKIKKPLLLGLVSFRDGLYYNSAELILDEKKLPQSYDKLHLVPFGEYIPLKKIFSFLEAIVPIGDFSKGKDYTVFKIPNSKSQIPNRFSVLICFEDIFPELARDFVKRGADFLVNITNDAWFGRSPAAVQHLMASVFRAIENRVYVVRCANTGISAFILPTGKISKYLRDRIGNDIFIEGYLVQNINVKKYNLSTFYNKYPALFPFLLFLIFGYGIIKNYAKI